MKNISLFTSGIIPYLPDCPEPLIEDKIKEAIIDFCVKTGILKVGMNYTVYPTEPDENSNYSVEIDISSDYPDRTPMTITKLFVDSSKYETEHMVLEEGMTFFDDILDDSSKKYFYFPEESIITIYPLEITAETNLYIEATLKPTRDFTTVEDSIYNDHLEVIQAGAKYRLFSIPKTPWGDPNLAMNEYRIWMAGMSEHMVSRRLIQNGMKLSKKSRGFI
jgi:hypothetical protein